MIQGGSQRRFVYELTNLYAVRKPPFAIVTMLVQHAYGSAVLHKV